MAHILVVDDDSTMRRVVGDAFRFGGHAVECVCNGRQALSAMGKHRPDAIILDLGMSDMDGVALVRTLREQTRWGRVPVVVVSSAARAQTTSERIGAQAYVEKPFDLSELLELVDGVVTDPRGCLGLGAPGSAGLSRAP